MKKNIFKNKIKNFYKNKIKYKNLNYNRQNNKQMKILNQNIKSLKKNWNMIIGMKKKRKMLQFQFKNIIENIKKSKKEKNYMLLLKFNPNIDKNKEKEQNKHIYKMKNFTFLQKKKEKCIQIKQIIPKMIKLQKLLIFQVNIYHKDKNK